MEEKDHKKAWRERNREAEKERARAYYAEHKEEINRRTRERLAAEPEEEKAKRKAQRAAYREANRESIRENVRTCKARRKAAMTPEELEMVNVKRREYYHANRERILAKKKAWIEAKKEKTPKMPKVKKDKKPKHTLDLQSVQLEKQVERAKVLDIKRTPSPRVKLQPPPSAATNPRNVRTQSKADQELRDWVRERIKAVGII